MNIGKAGSRAKGCTWPLPLEPSGLRMTAMCLEQAATRTLERIIFGKSEDREVYEALLNEQRDLLADIMRVLRMRNK
jgi:hypothetical protein